MEVKRGEDSHNYESNEEKSPESSPRERKANPRRKSAASLEPELPLLPIPSRNQRYHFFLAPSSSRSFSSNYSDF